MIDMFCDAGYEAQAIIVLSSDYYVPQERRRLYVVALKRGSKLWIPSIDFDDVFRRLLIRMNELKAKPTRLRDTLLGDRHLAVMRELDRREKSSKQSETATVRGQSYQKLCRDYCTQNGLRWGIEYPPSSAVAASPWFSALADAPSQILTILMKVDGEYCCVDTSQNVGAYERILLPPATRLKTLLPGSSFWLNFPAEKALPPVARPMLGREALALHSFSGPSIRRRCWTSRRRVSALTWRVMPLQAPSC